MRDGDAATHSPLMGYLLWIFGFTGALVLRRFTPRAYQCAAFAGLTAINAVNG